jgi:ubiquinone/menaquinone biosynthesis C-methylase UbiE
VPRPVRPRPQPLFARFYTRIAAGAERAGVGEHRHRLLDGLSGRVVEVGAGPGLNFAHYPPGVAEVVAVEPEAYLRARAAEAAARSDVPVRILDGFADALPLDDASCDAAVCSLVLCSVPSQPTALAELRRVLRPGGELRFYEHVADRDDPRWARRQRLLDPLWTRLAGGCHLTRDTEQAISAAGFAITAVDRFRFEPAACARLVAPHILGRAVRR